ncbi:MAG: SLBB domain-containing protein [Candidatus Eisenbacteria bacterium]|uniref:SLBB domain-containing protein n=1 Tax=Eiseniibacteriota bacterium TaxID=2212470 RepID=A0A938BR33_UNCEI|nr:SLBB domain-containing protein [Candidatus Eisenbacteria bacterium]
MLLGLAWTACATPGAAQSTALRAPAREAPALEALRDRLGASLAERSRLGERPRALEAVIDPAGYWLAPGDELALGLWGSVDTVVPLVVSADGLLIVPTVGAIPAAGLTLADAEGRLRAVCAPLYPRSTVTLSLVRTGLLRIPITGQVIEPGVYEAPSSFRLDDLVALAGGLRAGADARAVLITRAGSAGPHACDLLAWRVLGALDGNPVLRTGDRVQVPAARGHYRVRGLFPEGEAAPRAGSSLVDRPFPSETRIVPARAGDTLGFVLAAAGGLGAGGEGVWLERDGAARAWLSREAAEGEPARPGDIVEVPFSREWVAVSGAVQRPGLYPFLPGQTVADYIGLAGGPNQYGRTGGWRVYGPQGERVEPGPGGAVAAGAHILVPERRWYKFWTVLTPLGTAAAVVVSVAALLTKS